MPLVHQLLSLALIAAQTGPVAPQARWLDGDGDVLEVEHDRSQGSSGLATRSTAEADDPVDAADAPDDRSDTASAIDRADAAYAPDDPDAADATSAAELAAAKDLADASSVPDSSASPASPAVPHPSSSVHSLAEETGFDPSPVYLGCGQRVPACENLNTVGVIAGGAGIALIAGSTALLLTPDQVIVDEPAYVRNYTRAGTTLLALGAGLATTGLLMVLTAARASRSRRVDHDRTRRPEPRALDRDSRSAMAR